jgi:SAM-dependent methyltransferase
MWVSVVFDRYSDRYEAWFDNHPEAYLAEVRALRELMPATDRAVEIGVGTGRFAAPLGIRIGVDPSLAMARPARKRGVRVVLGVGESLPFPDSTFELTLLVTTVCFLDDIRRAFLEVRRVLQPKGNVLVGLVDRESPLGKLYMERRGESVFYSAARFYSVEEIVGLLQQAGFKAFEYRQTLFGIPEETLASEPVRSGYGDGGFVVLRGSVSGG